MSAKPKSTTVEHLEAIGLVEPPRPFYGNNHYFVPARKAREHLAKLVRAARSGKDVVITNHDIPEAVITSIGMYQVLDRLTALGVADDMAKILETAPNFPEAHRLIGEMLTKKLAGPV